MHRPLITASSHPYRSAAGSSLASTRCTGGRGSDASQPRRRAARCRGRRGPTAAPLTRVSGTPPTCARCYAPRQPRASDRRGCPSVTSLRVGWGSRPTSRQSSTRARCGGCGARSTQSGPTDRRSCSRQIRPSIPSGSDSSSRRSGPAARRAARRRRAPQRRRTAAGRHSTYSHTTSTRSARATAGRCLRGPSTCIE